MILETYITYVTKNMSFVTLSYINKVLYTCVDVTIFIIVEGKTRVSIKCILQLQSTVKTAECVDPVTFQKTTNGRWFRVKNWILWLTIGSSSAVVLAYIVLSFRRPTIFMQTKLL